jgi:flagellar basal body-associated protein FliL
MVGELMAENETDPPKVEENQEPQETPPGMMSLDKLDELINENDPEFKKTVDSIQAETGGKDLNLDLIDLDAVLEEEEQRSFKARIRRLRNYFRNWIVIITENMKIFVVEGVPAFFKRTKAGTSRLSAAISEGLRQFSFWPAQKKMATIGIILGVILTGVYVYLAATRDLVSLKTELFVTSLEDWSEQTEIYDPETESEPFYDSARASQNMMSLPKMVVNLRRSARSSPNPMGAFEFFVEGNSPDVMVEIKDREFEVKDLFLRDLEEFTFDQVDTADGKQLLLEKLRRDLNTILTKGRVRKIFFKTAIVKP